MINIADRKFRTALMAAAAASALCPALAFAQDTPAASPQPAAPDAAEPAHEDIIVTGTSVGRRALDTPLAVNTLDEQQLQRTSMINQADILNTIPTIKADGGGGEVAANVFVRGLPSGGQYQFTPLEYDGIPVLSIFGLNSTAYDVYYRNDLGLDRLEFVRGGVSNLFGPGSVAGLINYISKTGGDQLEGTAQFEWAERGRYKGDLAISGPLGHGFYFAASGWYRKDAGPIRTGLDTKGYQLRGNLKYEFPDNSGSVTLYGQYIDDKAQFYLPIPLDGATRQRIPGNDGQLVYQVITPNATGLGFNVPGGRFTTQIADGASAKGGQVALAFDKKLGDNGLGINGRFKYSQYASKFGLWSDGDGIVNVPETLSSFVTNAARRGQYPELNGITAANATFTYVGGGAVPANALLFANRITDRNRPNHDWTGELNLTYEALTGNVRHNLTLGGFYGNATAVDFNITSTYLAEFNNQPRLVNLTVTNPVTGATTVISQNGLLNAGAGYVNNRHQVEREAIYFADQMKIGDRFNLDVGGRYEWLQGNISREKTATFITDATTANLSAALRDVIYGNNTYLTAQPKTSAWAIAAGALYKLTDRVSLYLNGSRGYFFPEIRALTFNALGQPASYTPEIIKQVEGGIKIDQRWFNLTAAAFYTKLDNRRQINFINNGSGGFTEQVNLVGTRSWGVEATLDLKLHKYLHFNGNITFENAKYTRFDQNGTTSVFVGNELERQPDILYNAGLYYDDRTVDVSFSTNYTGDNYTASNNSIRLNGWNVFNLDAGVKLHPFGDDNRSVRVGINVFNLFKSQASTEGSPRQDINQTVGGAYFVGRPVLPRRITARATSKF
jgi:iron complex outermembrane receptor protein